MVGAAPDLAVVGAAGSRRRGVATRRTAANSRTKPTMPSHGVLAATPPTSRPRPAVQSGSELRVVRAKLPLHLLKYALLVLGQRHRYLRGADGKRVQIRIGPSGWWR